MKSPKLLLNGKTILISAVIAIFATVLIIYVTGLSSHRTILDNSLISLTTLAIIFFLFLTIGLYNGIQIHDDLSGKLKITWGKSSILHTVSVPSTPGSFDAGDGLLGLLLSVLLWIAMTILFILFLILLEFVLWAGAIGFIALLYWVLMRALKLIFSKSGECQNDLMKSVVYGVGYTLLYTGWIYGVIYISALF